jgi:hypothetical protein
MAFLAAVWSLFIEFAKGAFNKKDAEPAPIKSQIPMPQPTPPPTMPSSNLPNTTKVTVTQFCKAIEHLEGYFPPSAQHPTGTTAWRNRNPGNLRCPPLHSGATICRNKFNVFPDYATGFKAQEDNIIALLHGKAKPYGYYPEMDLLQFFTKRDPASDDNDPLSCALNVANTLGVSIHYKLSDLII